MGTRHQQRDALEIRRLHRTRLPLGNAPSGRVLCLRHGRQRLRSRADAISEVGRRGRTRGRADRDIAQSRYATLRSDRTGRTRGGSQNSLFHHCSLGQPGTHRGAARPTARNREAGPMNVFGLLSNARRRWSVRIAIRHGDRKRTYAELAAEATAFGVASRRDGLGEGDRVVIFLRNGLEFAAVLFGLFGAGLVAVPVNAKLHPREVAYIIENCGAKVAVANADMAVAIAEVAGRAFRVIVVGDAGAENSFEKVVDRGRSHGITASAVTSDQPAWIFYTSGTTGRPKGAVLSHRNIVAAAVNCLADIFSFQPEDRALHVAPLSHGSGLYLIPSLARGTENIIFDGARFDPDIVLATIARERITVLPFVAPTMIVRLL